MTQEELHLEWARATGHADDPERIWRWAAKQAKAIIVMFLEVCQGLGKVVEAVKKVMSELVSVLVYFFQALLRYCKRMTLQWRLFARWPWRRVPWTLAKPIAWAIWKLPDWLVDGLPITPVPYAMWLG